MSKTKNSNKKGNRFHWNRRRTIVVLIILVAYLVFDLSGIGGNVRFYSKWIECGSRPVISGKTYAGLVPNYHEAPILAVIRLSPRQFCTPKEAELNGYSASPDQYEFKYTSPAERYKSYQEGKIN